MYLIFGVLHDSCSVRVHDMLVERDCLVRVVTSPFEDSEFSWRLDTTNSSSRIRWADGSSLCEQDIDGILLRAPGWIDPTGWQNEDFSYAQTESQSALLAWLWSLDCQVINRLQPAYFYSPRTSPLFWQRLLQRSGLPTPEAMITNVHNSTQHFRDSFSNIGIAGVVYETMIRSSQYLVGTEREWIGLSSLQRVAPVCLIAPHASTKSVCVVGNRLLWSADPTPEEVNLESCFRQCAREAGLAFVEFILGPAPNSTCVVAVEVYPRLEHFSEHTQEAIIVELTNLLTAKAGGFKGASVLEESA